MMASTCAAVGLASDELVADDAVAACAKHFAAYGAAAKGNTFLNYCGATRDDIVEVYDANPAKQNRYLPGSHVPIRSPEAVRRTRPDYVVILPWNLKDEITRQLAFIADWGGRFVVASPETQVLQD